jgi:hypothetical protein
MNRLTADAEWRRLAEATSLTALLTDHVNDVAAVAIEDVPWLANLAVPDGWHGAITPDHRVRVAVYGNRPDGGWEASDTVSVFSFTGALTPEVLSHNADAMLHSLTATGIRIYSPNTPPVAGVAALRASGYITVAGRSVWARFNTYVSTTPHPRLVQHSSFVDAESFRALGADIGTLTAGVEDGFWSTIDSTAAGAPEQDGSSPAGNS